MDKLFELCVIDDTPKSDLSRSPNFKNTILVTASSEKEARTKAKKDFPMCDAYDISSSNNVPDFPVVLGKYPDLWLDENLTSCSEK